MVDDFITTSPTHHMVLVHFFLLSLSTFFVSPYQAAAACNQQDQDSLLSFSSTLSSSTTSPLNWTLSTDCCSWEGIVCADGDGQDSRVTTLSLPSRGLSGNVSTSLVNLTRLTNLNLSQNRLSGPLPNGFFSALHQLQVVDLSYNNLNGDLLLDFAYSTKGYPIRVLDFSSNHFSGKIQSSEFFRNVWHLTSFNVSNNSFSGQIPSFLCRNSSLKVLDFSSNEFTGEIPTGLGHCLKLQILRSGFNNLSGLIPVEIYSLVELEQLSLPVNHFSGNISSSITKMTKLTTLDLYSNKLEGLIPQDIGKISNLQKLQLHVNNLTGLLPPSIMNCTKLVTLNLRVNLLKGNLSALDFSPLQQLSTLDLGNNNFYGNLPSSLYLCKSLTAVRLASNRLGGQILPEILALKSLSFLSISNNNVTNITGAIRVLQYCKNLTTLLMAKNFFSEVLPFDDNLIDSDGFQNLQILGLGGCQFPGQVPAWLFKLKNLEVIDLSQNKFQGQIPSWLGTLPNLFYIDLSYNNLSGGFPVELCTLRALMTQKAYDEIDRSFFELPVFVMPNNITKQQYNQLSSLPPAIYLEDNNLSGELPGEIGQLKILHILQLNNNGFSGSIPDQLSNLTNLERLDLSSNNLSGRIPFSLTGLHFLSWFNVANNSLQGSVPSGGQFDTFSSSNFAGNPELCGPVVQRSCPGTLGPYPSTSSRKHQNTKLIVGLVLGFCFGAGLIIALLTLWILSKRRIIPGLDSDNIEMERFSSSSYPVRVGADVEKDISLVLLFKNNMSDMKDITIFDLLKATENFNQANIVGCGGFGLVYKATLENGAAVAVKKLSGDFCLMEREFKAEVEILSKAKHENLVSLQGYCVHDGCRLLIYTFMENGSLDYWLHEKPDGASKLDWPTRLDILRGASCGLAYMHHTCEPHIVHRDIKSSNILLDGKFKAHLADFGLSRLINPYRTHVTTELVGTLGYIPPEYGQAWIATLRGDVYSFGVVMLEVLTGKRPVEVFKPKMSRELVNWVQQMKNEDKQEEIFDPLLRSKGYEEEMLMVLDVACMCVNHNPSKRPSIQQVADWLKITNRHQNEGEPHEAI